MKILIIGAKYIILGKNNSPIVFDKLFLGACILHGMINTTATLFTLCIANAHELYSSIAGRAGAISCTMLTIFIYIFDKPFVRNYSILE